ncbi:MAG: CPBP family intramembrane metalloprotease [Flavobacteriaceae bacterium]|nr:CPBP family intramembrane metalloprotease [Flavobacteriaceae bacterium]
MKFIQQAYKGNNHWVSYLGTLMILFFGWQLLGMIPLVTVAYFVAGDMKTFAKGAENAFMNIGMDSNLFLFLMIVSFAFALISLLFGIKYLHKRKIITVLTSRKKLDWQRVFYSFGLWFIVVAIITFGDYYDKTELISNYAGCISRTNNSELIWNFKPIPFTILVLISFLFLPIQTSFEEILFRGYLMQGFGTWFKRPWVALVLTSVIFGLMHFANPEVDKLGMGIMVFYIGTGLVLGLMTLLDEGMELALGFHASNNIVSAILVTSSWSAFQTDALLIDNSEPSLVWSSFVPVFVLYPLILIVFSKKYGWKNWKEKLFGYVYPPIEINEDELIA